MQNQDPKTPCSKDEDIQEAIKHLEHAQHELEHARAEEHLAEQDVLAAERELERAAAGGACSKEIHFTLDGEPEITDRHQLTPNQIIQEYGNKDPSTHYLVQIEDGRKVKDFKGEGDTKIEMKDGLCFQIICTGPTPVSDGRPKLGMEAFLAGLVEMGFQPKIYDSKPDHVYFSYEVPSGKFAGKLVQLGFVVPVDFPVQIPTGPHVCPAIHAINQTQGPHPLCGVHPSTFSSTSEEWQYWSRPFREWGTRKRTVASFMSHILRLWETQ